ncbi:unnamed protein product, partial [Staurois parvus]
HLCHPAVHPPKCHPPVPTHLCPSVQPSSTASQCPEVVPVSVQQLRQSMPSSATSQCPAMMPVSDTYQCCLSVPPISAAYL